MSTTRPRLSIRKLLVEFTVIVVGVFVALAAETWWSEREEHLLEQEIRTDMAAEFASNIRILEADIAENEAIASHFARLVNATDEALLAETDAWYTENYLPFPNWAGFDPEIGVVQALINSGSLSSISDGGLRLRLARWAGLLRESERKTRLATDFQMIALLPTLAGIAADGTWTDGERRQARSLYDSMAILQNTTLDNQRALLDEARSIHGYLTEAN